MKWDTREPCSSCPYRKDAPRGKWHPNEFAKLVELDAAPMGTVYGCHATRRLDEPSVCGGWLLDQKRRDLPSITLRMALVRSKEAQACLREMTDGGHGLYPSIAKMVQAQRRRRR